MAETEYPQEDNHTSGWTGWIWFASFMMILSGIVHLVYGLAGIFTQDWYAYTSTGAYIFSLSSWGWAVFIVGILLILAALLLMTGNMAGRVFGVLLSIGSIFFNAALIGTAPIWSIIAIIVNLIIIYAITAHGREMKQYYQEHHQF